MKHPCLLFEIFRFELFLKDLPQVSLNFAIVMENCNQLCISVEKIRNHELRHCNPAVSILLKEVPHKKCLKHVYDIAGSCI